MSETYYLSMILTGVATFIFGTIPASFRVRSCPFFLSLILCLGGGVLLATSLVHMLSEVQPKLKSSASLYLCAGFLTLYIFDEISHYFLSGRTTENQSSVASYENNQRKENNLGGTHDSAGFSETSPMAESRLGRNYHTIPAARNLEWPHSHFSGRSNEEGFKVEPQQNLLDPYARSENHFRTEEQFPPNAASKTGLLVTLFLHSVLEGISVGVQTTISQMLMILGAVLFHKLVLAFCLGVELHFQGVKIVQLLVGIFLFSIGTPIGIFIGMTITSTENKILDVTSQLQAIAAGGLLYVAVIEVLPRERVKWQNDVNKKGAGIFQLIFVLLGFAFITVLHFFVGHVCN